MIKKISLIIMVIMFLLSANIYAADTYAGYTIPVDIDINGSFIKCVEKPILIDGTTYIPLRAFSDAVGGVIGWSDEEKAATMTKNGHNFVFYTGRDYCMADGVERNFASIIYKNLTFIPVRAVSELIGYGVLWDADYLTAKITAEGVEVADWCKDNTYTYEDILYLSKITYVECGNEPFEAMLGVASTVVNRAKSNLFPNTIKGVIFDTKYGTQFPPAHTDKINKTPSAAAIIAAKCALAGISNVGNSLYFISAASAQSSWAHKNRTHYKTMHGVAFYE